MQHKDVFTEIRDGKRQHHASSSEAGHLPGISRGVLLQQLHAAYLSLLLYTTEQGLFCSLIILHINLVLNLVL